MIKLAADGNEKKGGGHPTFSMGPPLSWMRSPLSIWNFFWVSLNLRYPRSKSKSLRKFSVAEPEEP
jgi:hypothetical protein